jgi:hypothetical protein
VRDQTSSPPVPAGTLAADTSTDRSPTAPLVGTLRCVVCSRESAWLLPPASRVSEKEDGAAHHAGHRWSVAVIRPSACVHVRKMSGGASMRAAPLAESVRPAQGLPAIAVRLAAPVRGAARMPRVEHSRHASSCPRTNRDD